MTQLRKAFLGPALRTRCRNCGKPVSVSWTAVLVSVPASACLLLTGYLAVNDHVVGAVLAFLLMLAVAFSFHAFVVKLVRRGA